MNRFSFRPHIKSIALFFICVLSIFGAGAPVALATPADNIDLSAKHITDNSFRVDVHEFSGGARYEYPLDLPPGRNGLQPDIALSYDSGNQDREAIIGIGWKVSIPSIYRLNKTGVENMYTAGSFFSALDGELASTSEAGSTQTFRARTDDGSFRAYSLSGSVWTVKDKFGKTHTFGTTTSGRIDDPNDSTRIHEWFLTEIRDANDNYVKYEYVKDGGQVYPARIVYTGNGATEGIFEIVFDLETTVRPDVVASYERGFPVTTSRRVDKVSVKASGNVVREYDVAYSMNTAGTASLLTSISKTAYAEEGGSITLPPATFTYTDTLSVGWNAVSGWAPPARFMGGIFPNEIDMGYRFADVNGDGYTDMLWAWKQSNTISRETYLNTGLPSPTWVASNGCIY